MISNVQRKMGEGLLAHLHLSAAEASVVIDETRTPHWLVVYVYDSRASRRLQVPPEWKGHPVQVRNIELKPLH